jgi:PTH1 family peptidyl-tRNA hydrolase
VGLLAKRHSLRLKRGRLRALQAAAKIDSEEVVLLQPLTHMNNSGDSVGPAASFFSVEPSQILVIFDDIYLPVGRLRLRRSGSDGGHRGLKSVIDALGTRSFPRLRIGVGVPPPWQDSVEYVLSPFERDEVPIITEAIAQAADAVEAWITRGIEWAMNEFNPPAGG